MSLVSIIMPVYNAEGYIKKSLESCLRQTHSNLEIVVINDGSTDNTEKILSMLESEHENIRCYHTENSGSGMARNLGIQVSKGKYLAFVDADDSIPDDYIETMYCDITNNSSDISMCGYIIDKGEKKSKVSVNKKMLNEPLVDYIVDNIISSPWSKLYRAKIVKDNNIEFSSDKIMQDGYFNLNYFKKVSNISFADNVFYIYNKKNSNSTIGINEEKYRRILAALTNQRDSVDCDKYKEEFNIRELRLSVLFPINSGYYGDLVVNKAKHLIEHEDIYNNRYIKKSEKIGVYLLTKNVVLLWGYQRVLDIIRRIKYA